MNTCDVFYSFAYVVVIKAGMGFFFILVLALLLLASGLVLENQSGILLWWWRISFRYCWYVLTGGSWS